LRAIDNWIGSDPSLERKVEFLFVGKRDDDLLRHRAAMLHPKAVRVEPLVAHRACIQAIRSSHACVVNTVGNRIPAKVYECMHAGKWILALTESDSDMSIVVRHYSRGIVVPAKNIIAICDALQIMMHRSGAAIPAAADSDQSVEKYSANHSAELLGQILDRLVHVESQP
jgi:hypothetical protein